MITCVKNSSIQVIPASSCPDWSTLAWSPVPTLWHQGLFSTYPLVYNLSGGTLNMTATVTDGLGNHFALYNGIASLLFTGGPCNCKLTVDITQWTFDTLHSGVGGVGFTVRQDGATRANFQRVNGQSAGVFDTPFTLIAGTNSLIELVPGLFDPGAGGPLDHVFIYAYDDAPMSLACTAQLSNV